MKERKKERKKEKETYMYKQTTHHATKTCNQMASKANFAA